jgi:hypothetical protein
VYVCTTAEPDYALEVWRLLDPGCRVIPAPLLPGRLLCVPGGRRAPVKSLLNVVLSAAGAPPQPVDGARCVFAVVLFAFFYH